MYPTLNLHDRRTREYKDLNKAESLLKMAGLPGPANDLRGQQVGLANLVCRLIRAELGSMKSPQVTYDSDDMAIRVQVDAPTVRLGSESERLVSNIVFTINVAETPRSVESIVVDAVRRATELHRAFLKSLTPEAMKGIIW